MFEKNLYVNIAVFGHTYLEIAVIYTQEHHIYKLVKFVCQYNLDMLVMGGISLVVFFGGEGYAMRKLVKNMCMHSFAEEHF